MTNRTRALVHRLTAFVAAASWILSGCGDTQSSSGNSNTNWLRICKTDAECGALQCLCGVCTTSCATETCRDVDSHAVCVKPTLAAATARCGLDFPSAGVCTTQCLSSAGCVAPLLCIGGACLAGPAGGSSESPDSGTDSGRDATMPDGAAVEGRTDGSP